MSHLALDQEYTTIHAAAAAALGVGLAEVEIVWTNPGTIYHDGSQDCSYGFTICGIPWLEAEPEERCVVVEYHDGDIRV